MNYTRIENSERLKTVARLWKRRWTTGRDTITQTGYMAPNTIACELERNGITVLRKREGRKTLYHIPRNRRAA